MFGYKDLVYFSPESQKEKEPKIENWLFVKVGVDVLQSWLKAKSSEVKNWTVNGEQKGG